MELLDFPEEITDQARREVERDNCIFKYIEEGTGQMKIGQAAQLTGLTISNIRFYERKGLLEPERNDQSKYRNYSEQDIRRLKQIILYRKMNMPIEKIASMLDDPTVSEELVRQQLQELLNKQQEIQGSIDLCRKLAADHAYDGENIIFTSTM